MEDVRELFYQLLNIKYMARYITAAGLLLLVISGLLWWQFVHSNPYNVWWGMLENNLSTSSVTRHLVQKSGPTQLEQYIGQQFGVNALAYGRTTLTSNGNTVKTETVGTLSNDFVRYTKITTGSNNNGKQQNFSSVLGKWADTPSDTSAGGSALPFFAQTMLGLGGGNLLPIANLNATQRQHLMDLLHKNVVFDTSFNNVKKQSLNGRQVYMYHVAIEPVAYVGFEKQLATYLGIYALDGTDPNTYQGQPPIEAQVSVDIRSQQLAEISLVGADHHEYYSSFGVPLTVTVPHATISAQKLQSRISQVL